MEKTQKANYFQISFWKALSIVAGAVLVAIVGTAFSIGSIANADHFAIVSASEDIVELQENTVRKDVYDAQQQAIIGQLEALNRTVGHVLEELRKQ